ncbi:hypothetical protein BaRGS_00035329 [Batillaria attramentaria]|uniref:Uncharacterized protein n=1 Tax=Batillaria attramentaria TaxID=370345 RepID=A0ABD0JGB1_9CAEN
MRLPMANSIAKKSTMDLMNAECEVTVGFLIENWTKFNLLEPCCSNHKAGLCDTPSLQTLHQLLVKQCQPEDLQNYLAVGVSRKGYLTHGESKEAFDQMYERKRTKKLSCNLKEFQTNAFPVIFRDGNIEIEGTMGYGSRTEIKIIIRPLNRKDLAEPAEAPRLQQD